VVDEQTLRALVKEGKATGPRYRTTLRTVIRNSYAGHYRRMVPKLLAALEFRSNNERHRPVMQALELVKRFADTKVRTFPIEEEVPLDGVVRGLWRDAVVEKDTAGEDRVNRVTYEVAVLEALREQLRCKEIWVVGGNRYRNPDEDLPSDFEANREAHYQALDLPLDGDRFISELQNEMREALGTLDAGLKKNPAVRITPKGGGGITLTPLDKQPDPPTLTARPRDQHALAAPDSKLHGLHQHADDPETDGPAALAGQVHTPRLRGPDPADLGAREPVWPVRSRYELATGPAVTQMAPGNMTVGSTPPGTPAPDPNSCHACHCLPGL
jgi:hypothetical protein